MNKMKKSAKEQYSRLRITLLDLMIEKGMTEQSLASKIEAKPEELRKYFIGRSVRSALIFEIVVALDAKIDIAIYVEEE